MQLQNKLREKWKQSLNLSYFIHDIFSHTAVDLLILIKVIILLSLSIIDCSVSLS